MILFGIGSTMGINQWYQICKYCDKNISLSVSRNFISRKTNFGRNDMSEKMRKNGTHF